MNDLYQEELMEIFKNPTNKGSIADPSVSVQERNPMCGDEIDLDLKVEEGIIKDAKFHGSLCSVSVISSDILLENLIGKTIEEAKNISKEDLLKWLNMNLSTSRVACATLVLVALEKAIKKYEQN